MSVKIDHELLRELSRPGQIVVSYLMATRILKQEDKGANMKPSIGRIVHYILTEQDVKQINHNRDDSRAVGEEWQSPRAQRHIGNRAVAGQEVPLIVTTLWPDEFGPGTMGINGQGFLDGNDSIWVTSVEEGTEHGMWHWPERVEG